MRCASSVLQPEKGGELACAERLERQRRQRREDVLRRPQRDPVEDLDQPPLPRIPGATPSRRRLRAADVILTQQQHLDREVRVRQQRRKRDQLVEHRHRRRALRRPAGTEHLAVLVDPNDPALGRDRVHDPDAVLVEQRVELACRAHRSPPSAPRPARRRHGRGRSRTVPPAPPGGRPARPAAPSPRREADPHAAPRYPPRRHRLRVDRSCRPPRRVSRAYAARKTFGGRVTGEGCPCLE